MSNVELDGDSGLNPPCAETPVFIHQQSTVSNDDALPSALRVLQPSAVATPLSSAATAAQPLTAPQPLSFGNYEVSRHGTRFGANQNHQ